VNDRPPFIWVDAAAAWAPAGAAIGAAREIAFDLEADGFHRYPERVSLLQIGLPDGAVYLVDPLTALDLGPLGRALADPAVPKVLHSASYDVRSLDRDCHFVVRGLFDTALAAQFCGARRTGLANVLADFLNVVVDKPKHLQRMDWSARPLPREALAYAVADVAHLLELRQALSARLADLGRTAWVAEECRRLEQARYEPPEPPEQAFLAVSGARDLDGAARTVLRELYVWREREALAIGRPPHRVMANGTLLALAADPAASLDHLRGADRRLLQRAGVRQRLRAALERGRTGAPVPWPRRAGANPWTPEARKRLAALKEWRNQAAEALDLDPGAVWPAPHLDQIALHGADPSDTLDHGVPPWVRDWQWAALGDALARFRRGSLGDVAG